MAEQQTNVERLKALRVEHFEFMVATMQAWMQFHGGPQALENALHDAARAEFERIQQRRQSQD